MSDTLPTPIEPIRWLGDRLELLDQRALPTRESYLVCQSAVEIADAIRNMVVRGAPAIGIAAGYALALVASKNAGRADRINALEQEANSLSQARPTAVNLRWAITRMLNCARRLDGNPVAMVDEAIAIHQEDIAQNHRMGELGASLLPENAVVMTHCNTGALATGGHGTALGVIRSAHRAGKIRRVYVTETRPWLQGARLTTWELTRENIPTTLIIDSAAGQLMSTETVDWLIVGADRITAAGDVANKIGTYGLAVLAGAHGTNVMVVAATSTFDLSIVEGTEISLENRCDHEIWSATGAEKPPVGLAIQNPVFDITPAENITAIVSELGVFSPPKEAEIRVVLDARKS